ncbi:MAG TPA: lytic transglycosylase domain-containing protein [Elusimicrobiota bacterium]|nr:lytic transglycosylase domain-containing protein [Elusimicrobiota bacterium]
MIKIIPGTNKTKLIVAAVSGGLLAFVVLNQSRAFWALARPVFKKDLINQYSSIYKIDPLLIMALVKVESKFQKSALSHRGAVGLMQLMPETAVEMSKKEGTTDSLDLADPVTNLRLGIRYLSELRLLFPTDPVAVLASYNAGPTNVRKWVNGGGPLQIDHIPFKETRKFVRDVQSTHLWLKRFQKVKRIIGA